MSNYSVSLPNAALEQPQTGRRRTLPWNNPKQLHPCSKQIPTRCPQRSSMATDEDNNDKTMMKHANRTTVSFNNFKSQNFKLSVSIPKSKYVAYLSLLSQISNCQSLGRKNKHETLKTDRNDTDSTDADYTASPRPLPPSADDLDA